MSRDTRFLVLSFVLIVSVIILSPLGTAAPPNHDPIKIANEFCEQMQVAYETENLPLFLRLYNDPVATIDVTRDMNDFYTTAELQNEITQMFAGFSGIKCTFADRQITAAGDMIMIRTLRSFTANEFPMVANCVMLMVLQKPFAHRQPWNYIVTDQILLKEEYLPKSEVSIEGNNITDNTLQQPQKAKKKHRLFW